jgi:hypothetical protein
VESCAGVVNEPHRSLESVSASTAAGRSARKAVNRPTEAREGVPVTDRNFSDRPDQSDQPRPRKVPSIIKLAVSTEKRRKKEMFLVVVAERFSVDAPLGTEIDRR